MKTKIFTFLVVLIGGLFMATSAFAQPSAGSSAGAKVKTGLKADIGSTISYSFNVSSGATWHWSIFKVSGTGNAPSITPSSTETQSVTWSAASVAKDDVYKVEAYVTDANGCYSEMYAFQVTIESFPLDFAGANLSQDAKVCSDLNGSVEGGNYTAGKEISDQVVYNLTYGGNDNLERIVFQIKDGNNHYYDQSLVDKGTTAFDIIEDISATPVDNANITITAKSVTFKVDANLYSVLGTNLAVSIISGKTTTGAVLAPGTTYPTAAMVVQAIPVISFP